MKLKNNHSKNNIAIIGAGAAGLFAAYSALRAGANVTIYERNECVGKKLLITGNGRCNFTNTQLNATHFSHPEFCQKYLEQFDTDYVCNVFASLGVLSFAEKNGCMYPSSQKASTIADALLHYIICAGGKIEYNACVSEIIQHTPFTFEVKCKDNSDSRTFDRVILACGGKASPKTGSDGFGFRLARGFGHTVTRTYPVLVQLKSDSSICRKCHGVRSRVNATSYIEDTYVRTENGELQITEYGLSGILIFNLSRDLTQSIEEGKQCKICIDFLPTLQEEEIPSFLQHRFKTMPQDLLLHFLEGLANPKLIKALLQSKNYNPEQKITAQSTDFLLSVLKEFKAWPFVITGHNGYENAQATKGGVLTDEVNKDLESRFVPGIYLVGEMLDVDADCGGYNLHWAWTSGAIAGSAAAKKG